MYLGEIVEIGPTEKVVRERKHPYTQLLLDASPEPDPAIVKPPLESAGEIPSAMDPPNGCNFHTRCPKAMAHCGWEGRDVLTAISEWRIQDGQINAVGEGKVEGLNVHFQPMPGKHIEDVEAELQSIMAARHPALLEAARFTQEEGVLWVRFADAKSPSQQLIASDHGVACFLYQDA